jgi:hypothetical protein
MPNDEMSNHDQYLRQFCESCQDETDHQVAPADGQATCLTCGTGSAVVDEDDRVVALIARVREEDADALRRFRDAPESLFLAGAAGS